MERILVLKIGKIYSLLCENGSKNSNHHKAPCFVAIDSSLHPRIEAL